MDFFAQKREKTRIPRSPFPRYRFTKIEKKRETTMYQRIMEQKGMKNLKKLIERWEALSLNVKEKSYDAPIILPDIFLVSRSGTGRTHLLNLLSDYLNERPNLMSFYGDVPYFEFLLNYCAPKEHFSEIQRLMSEISNAAGFRNEYRGIVFIDVDEWRSHFEEKHFINFLEYLSDNSNDWLVVLSVSDRNIEQVNAMEALISAFLRLERVEIERPAKEDLLKYALEILSSYGIEADSSATKLLLDSIGALCKNKYFDGYKTVKMLSQDVAYASFIKGGKGEKLCLSAADLQGFSKESDYVRRTVIKLESTQKIGFC